MGNKERPVVTVISNYSTPTGHTSHPKWAIVHRTVLVLVGAEIS